MKRQFSIEKIIFLLLAVCVLKGEESFENLKNNPNFSISSFTLSSEKNLKYSNPTKEIDETAEEANNLFKIASKYQIADDNKNALDNFYRASEIFKKIGNDKRFADCYLNIGNSFNNLGQYDKAIENIEISIKIYQDKNILTDLANAYNNIAIPYSHISNYDKAISYFRKSLKIKEKFDDKRGIAGCMINIGNVFWDCQKLDDALKYFENALEISQQINDKEKIGISYASIGRCINDKKDYVKALTYLKKALDIAKEMNNKRRQASYMESIGMIYQNIDSMSNAVYYLEKAQSLFIELNSQSDVSRMYYNFGRINLKLKKIDDALVLFNKSLEMSIKNNYRKLIYSNYDYLKDIYIIKNDYQKAYEYLKKYYQIKDSIFSEESDKRLINMKISYETEKKEQENELLKQENSLQFKYFLIFSGLVFILLIVLFSRYRTKKKSVFLLTEKNIQIEKVNSELNIKNELITNQNIELEKLNEELSRSNNQILNQKSELEFLNQELNEVNATKDKFFLIISHELLNPIRWLDNITGILQRKIDTISPGELKKSIDIVSEAAKHADLLLENLLQWAKTQTNRIEFKPEKINLSELVNSNISLLETKIVKKKLKIIPSIKEGLFCFADKNMLNSVIRNLLDNAIKFTDSEGEIRIDTDENDIEIIISIIDNGVGINQNDINKLFRIDVHHTTPGTGKEFGSGLGLILCKEYIEMNNGRIWFETELNKGTKFSFTVPKFS